MFAKRWCFVGIFTLLVSGGAMADPPAVHPATGEPLVINCLRGTPDAIDGDLSDWNLAAMTPAVLEVEEQLHTGQASWDGPEDCSGKFYLLWDDVNVYFAVVVKDDTLSMNKTSGDIWNADCIEFFFATLDAVPVDDHTGHYQWGFNANAQKWEWEVLENWTGNECDYLEAAASRTADGYICEAAIEHASVTAFDFTTGNTIGFHAAIDDTDNSDREVQMTWTGREAHDQSLGFGHMLLSAEPALSPKFSSDPSPEHDAVDVPTDVTLSWIPGAFAVGHDVYLGTVFDDVNEATRDNPMGVLVGQEQQPSMYDPLSRLEFDQTYYWRVDEVNGPPDGTIHKGNVWSFVTEAWLYSIPSVVANASAPTVARRPGRRHGQPGCHVAHRRRRLHAAALGEADTHRRCVLRPALRRRSNLAGHRSGDRG